MFKNDIYLPHAKASITDSVTDVESKLDDFINIYEREALEKCLGKLSLELFRNLDSSEPNLIKTGSDEKWDWLVNGHTYFRNNNDEVVWRGLRTRIQELGSVVADPDESGGESAESVSSGGSIDVVPIEYDYSFLAEYIYFFYEQNDFISRTDAGNVKVKAANATMRDPSFKVVGAYRRFVKAVQGDNHYRNSGFKSGFLGGSYVDYRGFEDDTNICLYQFINDMNELNPIDENDKKFYHNFNPYYWGELNQLTI